LRYQVRLSEPAYEDLAGIWAWIAADAGLDIADAYRTRLLGFLAKLEDFPRRGTPRDDLRPGIRSLVFERTIIAFYQVDSSIVTILRIVHGARDQSLLDI
jgi:toxin ParE1/3/4